MNSSRPAGVPADHPAFSWDQAREQAWPSGAVDAALGWSTRPAGTLVTVHEHHPQALAAATAIAAAVPLDSTVVLDLAGPPEMLTEAVEAHQQGDGLVVLVIAGPPRSHLAMYALDEVVGYRSAPEAAAICTTVELDRLPAIVGARASENWRLVDAKVVDFTASG